MKHNEIILGMKKLLNIPIQSSPTCVIKRSPYMLSVSSQNCTVYFNSVNMTLACIADEILCKVAKFWQQSFSVWQAMSGKPVRRMWLVHSNCSRLCHQNLGASYSLYTGYLDIRMCFYCLHLNYTVIEHKKKIPYSYSCNQTF